VSDPAPVAVIGGGVIGAAVVYTLARRDIPAVLLEAEDALALGASGANSGILCTGFDAVPGALETALIVRSAPLRDAVIDELAVPVLRCGALLAPRDRAEARTIASLAENAQRNGVATVLSADGTLEVPGEAVTDPVAYTLALAGAARAAGVEIRTAEAVIAIEAAGEHLSVASAHGASLRCRAIVNCAGLHADDVAALAGDTHFTIFPRKGEFFVFDPPGGVPVDGILLPVPDRDTKGVLVFPTVDGQVVAGPTARDQVDKDDWTVSEDARAQVLSKATTLLPALADAQPVASYAGLRPAGRGCNYVIERSRALAGVIHVAAIRSTGLSASLGIAEHVVAMLARDGVRLGPDRPLAPGPVAATGGRWWARAAAHREGDGG